MTAQVYGSAAAVEAVREFLEDGTHQGAGSPAQTFNGFLAEYRTALSVTTAVLPDIAIFETLWNRGSQATRYPSCSIVEAFSTGESEGPNSRMVDHSIEVAIFVLSAQIAGSEQAATLAATRYADALRAFFFRRVPVVAQGWTLNTGGTGDAQSRVIRCEVENVDMGVDDATPPNWIPLVRLVVRMQEAY